MKTVFIAFLGLVISTLTLVLIPLDTYEWVNKTFFIRGMIPLICLGVIIYKMCGDEARTALMAIGAILLETITFITIYSSIESGGRSNATLILVIVGILSLIFIFGVEPYLRRKGKLRC